MKKNTRVRVANLELKKRRVLRLAQETVRALTAQDLTGVIAGNCNTTSWSTEAPPNTKLC